MSQDFEPMDDPALPPALAKALRDPFDYAMGLRDGTVIRFTEASMEPGSEWVHINFEGWHGHEIVGQPFTFERGLDVRISEIAWIADAPQGS